MRSFILMSNRKELVQRSFAKNTALDYWESGMDLGLSRDMFDSFMQYQMSMQSTFKHLQTTYGFTIVDGMRAADAINLDLRKRSAQCWRAAAGRVKISRSQKTSAYSS